VWRREDEVVLYSMNVIFVQWLCTMLSVCRKTTELTVLADSSTGFIVSARKSERLTSQGVNNDWEITPKLFCMYAELKRLTVWCMYEGTNFLRNGGKYFYNGILQNSKELCHPPVFNTATRTQDLLSIRYVRRRWLASCIRLFEAASSPTAVLCVKSSCRRSYILFSDTLDLQFNDRFLVSGRFWDEISDWAMSSAFCKFFFQFIPLLEAVQSAILNAPLYKLYSLTHSLRTYTSCTA